jgi:hypothetical protein
LRQPDRLLRYTRFTGSRVVEVADIVAAKIRNAVATAKKSTFNAVYKKYNHENYHNIPTKFDLPTTDDL